MNFTDPDGKQIIGVTKDDALQAQNDINSMFSDKRFDSFRSLINVKGKTFNKIDDKQLKTVLSNSDLSEDDKTLIEIVSNTINSSDEHIVEYANENENVSDNAVSEFGLPAFINKEQTIKTFGGFPASIFSLGGGRTAQTKKGTFSLIVTGGNQPQDYVDSNGNDASNPVGRPLITGHEIFGHGRSLATGRGDSNQHQDAIKLENLILKVMGHKNIQRSGLDHKPFTKVSSGNPEFK